MNFLTQKEIEEEFDGTFKDDTAGEDDVGVIVEGNTLVDCERIKSFLHSTRAADKEVIT